VSGNGAYENEMNEISLFENALRAAVRVEPDPRVGADLVPRLARLARESSLDAGAARLAAASGTTARRGRPRSRFALVARIGLAGCMLVLLLAGLAVAGVTMPHSVRSAFDSVGVTLPNQPNDTPANNQGNATSQPSGQSPASDKASEQGKQASAAKGANGKHRALGKSKSHGPSGPQPGRRVRRHGNLGSVPGPAHPPQGHAYGPTNSNSKSSGSNAGGGSKGNSGVAQTQTQDTGQGQAQGHSK